ncbi:hypothetical protein [Stutzerimonas stutzeri]
MATRQPNRCNAVEALTGAGQLDASEVLQDYRLALIRLLRD